MNTYKMRVICEIAVDAYNSEDAVDIVDDSLGEGDYGVYVIDQMEIVNIQEV